jgi:hypothetical protein
MASIKRFEDLECWIKTFLVGCSWRTFCPGNFSLRNLLLIVNRTQIVPVKVKFSQFFPKISKIADKISLIINMLYLCSFDVS